MLEMMFQGFTILLKKRGLKSHGFTVSRFYYEGRVVRVRLAMCAKSNISINICVCTSGNTIIEKRQDL